MELLNELPTWARFLVVYGPLGVWAVVSSWALWKQHLAHHATRTEHEVMIKVLATSSTTAIQTLAQEHSSLLVKQAELHATRIAEVLSAATTEQVEQATLHHEQMTELTTKFVTLNQQAFAQAQQATAEATKLVEAVQRAQTRR